MLYFRIQFVGPNRFLLLDNIHVENLVNYSESFSCVSYLESFVLFLDFSALNLI